MLGFGGNTKEVISLRTSAVKEIFGCAMAVMLKNTSPGSILQIHKRNP